MPPAKRPSAPTRTPLLPPGQLSPTPPPGSPFFGISKTNAPAKTTSIPHLTAQVQLAKARKQRSLQGGLLTPQQRAAEQKAARTLAAKKPETPPARTKSPAPATKRSAALPPPARTSSAPFSPPARKPTSLPTLPPGLLKPSTAPFTVPLPSTPGSTTPLPTGPRRAQPAFGARGGAPNNPFVPPATSGSLGGLLGGIAHAADVGLGTGFAAAASVPGTLLTPIHPGATHTPVENVKPTTLARATTDAAAKLSGLGTVGRIPHGFSINVGDLVGTAAAATGKKAITVDELKALEKQGVDLSPRLDKRFTAMALKNGWNPAELDGISGSAKIDKAFTKPPNMALRILGNAGAGVVRLGALPAAVVGITKETAAGHGGQVAQQLGEGLISELPLIGKHKTTDTAVADPFGFITQFAGTGKTLGALGKVGKVGEALRTVESASSGAKIARGALDRNAYNAVGQVLGDKAASTLPALGRHAEGEQVHKLVRRVVNEHAAPFNEHRQGYAQALHKVGDKRAAELLAYQAAGGEPGRIAAFYAGQSGKAAAGQAKALAHIAKTTQDFSPDDEAFLAAHSTLAQHTSEAYVHSGKFFDSALKFRQYSPLIRTAAHRGDPEAQQILAMRSRLYGDTNASLGEASDTAKMHAQLDEIERELKKHQDAYGAAERVSAQPPPRPAAGSGAAAQQHWRQQNKAWQGRARTARTRMRTHLVAADRLTARAEALTRRERAAGALSDPQHAALEGAYSHAVDQFIQGHAERGGIEPARVAYTQPPQAFKSPFARSGTRMGFKTPTGRQPLETGAAFESGKYLIDPSAPLRESMTAQATHVGSFLHAETIKEIGKRAESGAVRPAGWVYVSDKNLTAARRTTHDLADNPVSMHDYHQAEEDHKSFLFNHLTAAAKELPTGERVPRGEKGWFIPGGSWKTMLRYTAPASRNAYDRAISRYQRALISYRPSTVVNNALGSAPLAMLGGAGPKSFYRAARSMADPTTAPFVLRGRGVAGAAARDYSTPIGAAQQFLRRQSQRGEDFARLAAYWSKAGKGMKKRASDLNMTMDEYARSLAAGKVDLPLQERALDHAEAFLSDQLKPDGSVGKFVGKGLMFHRWVGHMAKLILVTLPLKHPRRAAILNTLAAYGDQYRKDHGVWPDWYTTYLPLFQHVERVGAGAGVAQTFTKTFNTGGVNPFATLDQYGSSLSTADDPKEILRSALNPLAQAPFNALFGPPAYSPKGTSTPRYVAAQLARAIPGVSVVKPQSGMSPDSIPFISEHRRVYSTGRPGWGGFKAPPLNYDLRATPRPEGGILGGLLRYGLGGVYDLPAQGPVHNIEQKKHIGAVAKAARRKH